MLIETALRLDLANLALAMGKALKYSKLAWLSRTVALVQQCKASDGKEVLSDVYCLSQNYLVKCVIKTSDPMGEKAAGVNYMVDNARMLKGIGKMQANNPAGYGRIATNAAKVNDCIELLQYVMFGYLRF
jgi:bifunctional N-acetylglucosamine-1-phosphate-uridyltransferase/glucosamine-1-phosphate-acetyltransferase GlmU-like protein